MKRLWTIDWWVVGCVALAAVAGGVVVARGGGGLWPRIADFVTVGVVVSLAGYMALEIAAARRAVAR